MFTARAQTGIDLLDQSWDGLSRGATYLFYGPAQTGRILLVLQVTRAGADAAENTILISGKAPRELATQARTIDFDLEAACRDGHVRLLRLPEALLSGGTDAFIEKALRDLGGLIRREQPVRVVIEDFTPFVRFSRFETLRPVIEQFLSDVAAAGSTLILALGEPANARSEQIVSFLRTLTAGSLHLAMDPGVPDGTARRLTLQPTLGSGNQEREFVWDLTHLKRPAPPPSGDSVSGSNGDGWPDSVEGEPDIEVRPTPPEIMPPPSADAPPADIRFFDPKNPLGPTPQIRDPFGDTDDAETAFEHAHYVEGANVRQDFEIDDDASPTPSFEVPVESTPPFVPESPPTPPKAPAEFAPPIFAAPVEPVKSDRELFADAFDAALSDYRNQTTPFLAVALRLPSDATPEAFFGLDRALRASIDSPASIFVDRLSQRLVVLLPNSEREASQELFRRMKLYVSASHPDVVSSVLPRLAAVVVPNGHPFTSGSAFLTYVFDTSQA